MGRAIRITGEQVTYHLMARGSGRKDVFLGTHDRYALLRMLDRISLRRGWRTHAWCLMTNHFHLLTTTMHDDLSAGMCELLGQYSRHFGYFNHLPGHLFSDRFRSVIVTTDDQLLTVVRYIARNPVRAGLARSPEEYRWSSYADRRTPARALKMFDEDLVLGTLNPRIEIAEVQLRALVEAADEPSRVHQSVPSLGTLRMAFADSHLIDVGRELGYSSQAIAGQLGVAPRTVRRRLSRSAQGTAERICPGIEPSGTSDDAVSA